MKLPSKLKNIIFIKQKKIKNINLPIFFYSSKRNFLRNKKSITKKIYKFNKKNDIIIRSSAFDEDKNYKSNAGKYNSLILLKKKKNTIIKIREKLINYITQFKNYNDYIIFQKFISNVDYAGVIFTSDINHDTPYLSINYDKSGKTNLITSGKKNIFQKNLIIFKKKKIDSPKKFHKLINITLLLEKKFNNNRLDIEFAVKNNIIYIFQVRILPKQKKNIISNKVIEEVLVNIKKKILKFKNKNILLGKTTYFSNMSDWNPAEMLGNKPSYLGLTIYKELITNQIWSHQRKLYGYKDVSPNELLINFAGSPYIDLRTDLNSFLPKNIPDKLGEKIINNSLNIIKKKPFLHDKIEFECINTCLSLDTKNKTKYLKSKNQKIYLNELRKITNDIVNYKLLNNEIKKLKRFEKDLIEIKNKKISQIQKIFYLNHIIKYKASLPFAGIARIAFVCTKILKDLNSINYLSNNELKEFFSNIDSINTRLSDQLNKVKLGKIKKIVFLKEFGHLRPSTYDINSKNYSENFNNYFKKNENNRNNIKRKSKFLLKNRTKIQKKFNHLGYNFSISQFLKISKMAIALRERGKFIYSKGINEIFNQTILLGKEINIKRKDLAFLDYNLLLYANSNLESEKFKKLIKNNINKNKKSKKILDIIKLPDIIFNENSPYYFEDCDVRENFITLEKCLGNVMEIKSTKINFNNLKNKIIFIENADPGYDFIFNSDIKGLVTKYGGVNSHMSIRCLELNLPAVIGIGEKKYNNLLNFSKIYMDCEKKIIKNIN